MTKPGVVTTCGRVLIVLVVFTFCSSPAAATPKTKEAPIREVAVRFPGSDVELAGVVFAPGSPARSGDPHPAIVLMHGCSGMVNARGELARRHRDWAERFARSGFVALAVDSFGPRGIRSICDLKERPAHPWRERTADAYAALDYLASRADVDPRHVFILGWSHGGSTVTGVVRPEARGQRAGGPRFRAAIAFYPGCSRPLRQKDYRTTMPMLILHGEADDWTPAAPCVELAQRLQNGRFPVTTIVFPGAHHGFDQPGGAVRFLPNVYNPRAPGERGAHVGAHEPSRLKAIDETKRFLDRYVVQ
jgi:dienelactone hydrolase